MSTSAIGSALDALVDGLAARSGLSGVTVFSAPPSPEEAGLEGIWFGDCELTEIEHADGGSRLETWKVYGETYVKKAWATSTEATNRAARDRALALFAEVESYLNDTYTGSYPHATLSDADMIQNYGPSQRQCGLRFVIEIKNVKNP